MDKDKHSLLSTTKPCQDKEQFIINNNVTTSNFNSKEVLTMFSVQIPASLRKRIRMAAVSEDCSQKDLVTSCLNEYLQKLGY